MAETIRDNVMTARNREIEFGKNTGKLCPRCGKQSKQTLRVRSCHDHMEQLECANCGYTEHRAETVNK